MRKTRSRRSWCVWLGLAVAMSLAQRAGAQDVTYKPYIALGDAGSFGSNDQMVIAWQTNEKSPNPSAYSVEFGTTPSYGALLMPSARVVDNYLADLMRLGAPPGMKMSSVEETGQPVIQASLEGDCLEVDFSVRT